MTSFITTEVVHIHTWTWPPYWLGPSAVAHAALPLGPALLVHDEEMKYLQQLLINNLKFSFAQGRASILS